MDTSAVVFLLMFVSPFSGGQDCPGIEELDASSRDHLLANAIAGGKNITTNTVCLGQGAMRNTYRTTSLVIEYSTGMNSTRTSAQAEFQCMDGEWGVSSLHMPPDANLTTPRRTDCTLCINPDDASMALNVAPIEHCAGN